MASDQGDDGQDKALSRLVAGAKTVEAIFEAQKQRRLDWSYWGSMIDATLQETICLSLNVSPEAFRSGGIADGAFLKEFHRRHGIVANHIRNGMIRVNTRRVALQGNINYVVLPDFAAWVLREMDWPPLPEQFPGVRALRAAAEAAKAPNLPAAPAASGPWPWGTYETKWLKHLAAAAEHSWISYDPRFPATAPTSEDVTAWLIERGVPKRVAEIMAQILRDDALPPGPRVNK